MPALLNVRSEFSSGSSGTFLLTTSFNLHLRVEEDSMKKFGYVIAALGAIAVAAPTIASAETTTIIKRGGYHHDYGRSHAEFRVRDRGWHQGWRHHDHDRVVIKERHNGY
jgi:hypothetical protein